MSPDLNQPASSALDTVEPRIERTAIPIWLIILLFILFYWGMVYFDLHGAWFNPEVYAPYKSVAELEAFQPPKGADDEILLKGKGLFGLNCAVCHMENGSGNPGNGCPPLAGSEWVIAPGPARIIRIVSKGMAGPIEVKGQVYNIGTMLPIGDQLPGDENQKAESIAAIISYIRKSFGNNASIVKPEQVLAVRAKIKDRTASFTPDEVKGTPENE